MVQHTTRGLAYPEGGDSVQPRLRDFKALADTATAAITDSVNEGAPMNAHPNLAAGTNLDNITTGTFATAGTNVTNAPTGAGNGFVHTFVNPVDPETSRLQTFWELGTEGRVWTRFRGTGSWTAWRRIDAPRTAERLPAGTNLDNVGVNSEYVAYPGMDSIVNAPPSGANGIVKTFYVQALSQVQMYYELGVADRIWRRFRGTGSWTAWSRVDAAYAIEQSTGGESSVGVGTTSSLKTLPVVLSASTNFAPVTIPEGAVRFPLNLNAPTTRWRLCIRNHNYRTSVTSSGGASFTGLWVGKRSGQTAAFASAPTQVSGPFTLPTGGGDFALPWVHNVPLGDGADLLLSLGWTGAGEATRSPAGCYRSTSSTTGGATSGAGYTADVSVPFSWWIEVETTATTPVVAIWGDSISCGTGNDFPIHESPLSQYCRLIGAIPFHAGYPGTNMGAWEPSGSNYAAWDRFAHLSRPDAVIHFMGQNDLITADLAEMKRRHDATIGLLKQHVSPNVYYATLTPTSTKSAAQNTIRKNYNEWLRTLPNGRDVFEFGPAVANANNDALLPVYDSGDALHLSTAGSTALADAVTRPITSLAGDAGAALAAYLNEIN